MAEPQWRPCLVVVVNCKLLSELFLINFTSHNFLATSLPLTLCPKTAPLWRSFQQACAVLIQYPCPLFSCFLMCPTHGHLIPRASDLRSPGVERPCIEAARFFFFAHSAEKFWRIYFSPTKNSSRSISLHWRTCTNIMHLYCYCY